MPSLRRSHRKSRAGCAECKRRHIRCDETHPQCINCTTADRQCEFPALGQQLDRVSDSPLPGTSRSTSPSINSDENFGLIPSSQPARQEPALTTEHTGMVNMAHMELFANFSFQWIVPELNLELLSYCTQVSIRSSLDAPYLMHAMLAISARHLAVFGNPSRADFYLLQAVELQNQAIALFNSTGKPALRVDPSNCVPMLLFASLLARHLLTDVLSAARDKSSLEDFLDAYMHYVQVHSGVRAILRDSWSTVMESQLRPLVDWGRSGLHVDDDEADSSEETGSIRQLLDTSSLGESAVRACKGALSFLQIGLGERATAAKQQERRVHIIFNWTVMAPPEFTDLLKRRVPEAIAILGYYAVLLHYGRNNWQVGNVGAYLLGRIADHLGKEWEDWLAWPREAIARDKA